MPSPFLGDVKFEWETREDIEPCAIIKIIGIESDSYGFNTKRGRHGRGIHFLRDEKEYHKNMERKKEMAKEEE